MTKIQKGSAFDRDGYVPVLDMRSTWAQSMAASRAVSDGRVSMGAKTISTKSRPMTAEQLAALNSGVKRKGMQPEKFGRRKAE